MIGRFAKMSFTSLLIHGLGAIAVFIEIIASRLLIFSLLLIGISLIVILGLLGIKTFTKAQSYSRMDFNCYFSNAYNSITEFSAFFIHHFSLFIITISAEICSGKTL